MFLAGDFLQISVGSNYVAFICFWFGEIRIGIFYSKMILVIFKVIIVWIHSLSQLLK